MPVEALPILYSVLLCTNTLSSDTEENKGTSVCEAITSTPERVQKAKLKVNASESSFVVFNFSYLILTSQKKVIYRYNNIELLKVFIVFTSAPMIYQADMTKKKF